MGVLTRAFSAFLERYGEGAPEIFLSALIRQKIGKEFGKDPKEVENGKAFEEFPNFIPIQPFHSKFSIALAETLREASEKIKLEPRRIYSLYLKLKRTKRRNLPSFWPPDEGDHLQIYDLLALSFYQGNLEGRTLLITNSIVDYYFASLFTVLLGIDETRYFLFDPTGEEVLETAMGFGIRRAPVYSSLKRDPKIEKVEKVLMVITPVKMRAYGKRKASELILRLLGRYLCLGGHFRIFVPEHYFFGPKGLLMNFSLLDGTHLKYSEIRRVGSFVEVKGVRERRAAKEISWGRERLEMRKGAIIPRGKRYRALIGRGAYLPKIGVMFGNKAAYLVIKLEDLGDLLLVSSTYLSGARENFFIEKELYMDCLRSQEIEPWRSIPRMGAVVPVKGERIVSLSELLERYPNVARYFVRRYHMLVSRRGASFRKLDPWRRYEDPIEAIEELKEHDPPFYYFPFEKEHFLPYKVFWKWSSKGPYASTYLEGDVLPVSGTIFIGVECREEATYLLAFLNSSLVREVLKYLPSTSSPRILGRIKIPRYEESIPEMRELSRLGKKAYEGEVKRKEIDEVVEQIVDLTLS